MMGRSLSREERKIQAEMEMFKKMEQDPVAAARQKTPRDKSKPDDPRQRRPDEEVSNPKRQKVEPEPAPLKKPGLKGKFGKKAWLQEFKQAETEQTAPSEPVPSAPVVESTGSEKKSHGNIKKKWASSWGDAGVGMKLSEQQISAVQTIESTEAQLKKLRDQRCSTDQGAAGEAAAPPTRQLSALEEQEKRLAEAKERVRRMQEQARQRAEAEAKQAAAERAAVESATQQPALLIAETEQRVILLQQQQQQLQQHQLQQRQLQQQQPSGELQTSTGMRVAPEMVEPAISYSPPDSWSDDEPAASKEPKLPVQQQPAMQQAPRGEPVLAATVEQLGLAGSKFVCALAEIVYMRREHHTLYPTCSTNEMLHRLDDVRMESEHRDRKSVV